MIWSQFLKLKRLLGFFLTVVLAYSTVFPVGYAEEKLEPLKIGPELPSGYSQRQPAKAKGVQQAPQRDENDHPKPARVRLMPQAVSANGRPYVEDGPKMVSRYRGAEQAKHKQPEESKADGESNAALVEGDDGTLIPVSFIRGRIMSQGPRYVLGPGDKISIKIKDLEDFDQSLTIRPDGYGTIHPLGEVKLLGTDVYGLQIWLKEKFKFYLLDPKVTVSIDEMRPALLYVSGAVNRPGTYQFLRQGLNNSNILGPGYEKVEITLTNILSKVGGLNESADIENIRIVHASTGYEETYNLRKFLETGVTEDVWLLPGDSIVVPSLPHKMSPDVFKLVSQSSFFKGKFPVLVLGAVRNQGEIQMDPSNNSLNAALALAGGFIKHYSAENEILVQRPTDNGKFNHFVIDRNKTDIALLPGDVVYVSKTKFSDVERVVDFLVSVTQPFFFGTGSVQFVHAVTNDNSN